MAKIQQDIKSKSTLFAFLFLFGFVVAFSALSGNYVYLRNKTSMIADSFKEKVISLIPTAKPPEENNISLEVTACSNNKKNITNKPVAAELQALQVLETYCQSSASTTLMLFTSMPNSDETAKRMALTMSDTLKEFAKYNIRPLVIIEPDTTWGLIDFREFGTGFYNEWLNEYFKQLKGYGITDEQMGIWVPFPEANLPHWNSNNSKPDQIGKNITIYVTILKQYFPTAHTSVLLNAASYPSDDFNWENGAYTSLIPYIKSIPEGLVDSFGIQGFPWQSPATSERELKISDPYAFLGPDLAIEAAKYLKVSHIWLNTGTYKTKYAQNPSMAVTVEAKNRASILSAILQQASYIKTKGFIVSVNIFAENKAKTPEATDWSYWDVSQGLILNDHAAIFLQFLAEADKQNIPLWYFDKMPAEETPAE